MKTRTKYSACVFVLCIVALITQQHCDLHLGFVIKCKFKQFLNHIRQRNPINTEVQYKTFLSASVLCLRQTDLISAQAFNRI